MNGEDPKIEFQRKKEGISESKRATPLPGGESSRVVDIQGKEWIEVTHPASHNPSLTKRILSTTEVDIWIRIIFTIPNESFEIFDAEYEDRFLRTVRSFRKPGSDFNAEVFDFRPGSDSDFQKESAIIFIILVSTFAGSLATAYFFRKSWIAPWHLFVAGLFVLMGVRFFPRINSKNADLHEIGPFLLQNSYLLIGLFLFSGGLWLGVLNWRRRPRLRLFSMIGNFIFSSAITFILWDFYWARLIQFGVVEGRPRRMSIFKIKSKAIPGTSWATYSFPQTSDEVKLGLSSALEEHASVASFSELTRDLIDAGAPPDLVSMANRAAYEEIQHAKIAFSLASAHEGVRFSPAPIGNKVLGWRHRILLERLALESFRDGCINEGIAAQRIKDSAKEVKNEEVRRLLLSIGTDETGHADLAWKVVDWCLSELAKAQDKRTVNRVLTQLMKIVDSAEKRISDQKSFFEDARMRLRKHNLALGET